MSGQGQQPVGFDATVCPIIARHIFGVEPFRPIGLIIVPIVRRFESLQEVVDVPA